MSTDPITPDAFIQYWSKAEASEMANSQSFINGLTRMLGLPQPSNTHAGGYSFNFPLKVPGTVTTNWIDLYRRGHFVWESKQFRTRGQVMPEEPVLKSFKNIECRDAVLFPHHPTDGKRGPGSRIGLARPLRPSCAHGAPAQQRAWIPFVAI